MSRTPQEELVHFLSDMYSVEQQALAQLVSAPDLAGDASLAAEFRKHYVETQQQAELVGQRLEAAGGTPSTIKNLIMKAGGKGFLLFAQLMPETPGRLVAHAYAYEAMEWAGYEMLIRFAEGAGDTATADVARKIRDEERQMMKRLERGFDAAEAVSHGATPSKEMGDHVRTHLGEAHALETQAEQLLGKSKEIAVSEALAETCASNLEAAHEHSAVLEAHLKTLGSSPSTVKDSALGLGGMNWALFFQAQADTPAKLAAFVYAFEHLKIAGYELLKRTAKRAGDHVTARVCDMLLEDERAMVEDLASTFDSAVEASLAVLQ